MSRGTLLGREAKPSWRGLRDKELVAHFLKGLETRKGLTAEEWDAYRAAWKRSDPVGFEQDKQRSYRSIRMKDAKKHLTIADLEEIIAEKRAEETTESKGEQPKADSGADVVERFKMLLKEAALTCGVSPMPWEAGAYADRAWFLIRDAIAALQPTVQNAWPLSGWQSIETAPKDGTEILGQVIGDMAVIWWDKLIWRYNWDDNGQFACPTHWMPLPQPPAARAKAGA